MLYKITLVTIFILLNLELSFCQQAAKAVNPNSFNYPDTAKKIIPAKEDDLLINVRLLPDSRIEEYKNDQDFNYQTNQPVAEDWITKIVNWFKDQIANLSSSETYSTILDFLYYGLMFLALILIIRGLIRGDRRGLLFGKIQKDEIKLIETEEDINNLDFDDLITSAIESENFKLAVRYLFLKSLQKLSEKGIIELRSNKSNLQYLSEISNNQISNLFHKTTSLFEWVWYGNFPVDEKILKTSQNEFNELFGLLASS